MVYQITRDAMNTAAETDAAMPALPLGKYDYDYRDKLREMFEAGLDEDTAKRVKKAVSNLTDEIADGIEWWIKDDLAGNLADYVEDQANRAIEAMLAGNVEMVRRYLGCSTGGYTGRDHKHDVIHGRLFETGGIEARKRLVDAFADLIKDERILDLESQVAALVERVNEREARIARLEAR